MPDHSQRVTFYLTCRVRREGGWYISECLSLPVTTQGRTDTEAMANLMEAIQLFVETCLSRRTLEQVLLKHHWEPTLRPHRDVPPGTFALPVPLPQVVKRHLEECRTWRHNRDSRSSGHSRAPTAGAS